MPGITGERCVYTSLHLRKEVKEALRDEVLKRKKAGDGAASMSLMISEYVERGLLEDGIPLAAPVPDPRERPLPLEGDIA